MSPLHPQAQAILQRIKDSGEPAFETMTAQQARAIADARVIASAGQGPETGPIRENTMQVKGRTVTLRIYRPKDAAADAALPLLIYYHGGGFVVGNLDTVDTLCRIVTESVGCTTVSIGYSLAPEFRFPAQAEDSYAATDWIIANAAALGADPSRIALAGESSGGTLAAAMPQMARAEGANWPLLMQIMVYPGLDWRMNSASYHRLSTGYFLTRDKMMWFRNHFLNTPDEADDPRASPLLREDLTGLPPAVVITADLDPLVDEGNDYAARLRAAGVPVELYCYQGWPHGFAYWAGTEAFERMKDTIIAALRRAFAPG